MALGVVRGLSSFLTLGRETGNEWKREGNGRESSPDQCHCPYGE